MYSVFQEISSAIIPYCDKDEMRNKLKKVKKIADDADRARKAAMTEAVSRALETNQQDFVIAILKHQEVCSKIVIINK
jgi:glycerol-3-phosphate cytidylyltransferase-like family protein